MAGSKYSGGRYGYIPSFASRDPIDLLDYDFLPGQR